MLRNRHFQYFLATRGSKLGRRDPKPIKFWTLTQKVYTPSLEFIKWILFQVMTGNRRWADARMDGHMHGWTLTIRMSHLNVVAGENEYISTLAWWRHQMETFSA